MNPLMKYSTALIGRTGRGYKSFKNKLKESGQYHQCLRDLRKAGLTIHQIRSILRETQPITEFEVWTMQERKCDLLEARSLINDCMLYGLIEFEGGKPNWSSA
jgi:hypothetical protein